MNWKPNKWISAVLGLLIPPLGPLYANSIGGAALVFGAGSLAAIFAYIGRSFTYSNSLALWPFVFALGSMVFSYRIAVRASVPVRRWHTRWYGLVAIYGAFFLVLFTIRAFLYEPFRASSSSMEPAIPPGSLLAVQKWGLNHFSAYGLRLGTRAHSIALSRGDIIAFEYPLDRRQTYVYRIAGLPGDKIIYRDNHLLVNGIDARVRQLGDYKRLSSASPSPYANRFRETLGGTEFDIILNKDGFDYPASGDFDFKNLCSYENRGIECEVPKGNYFVLGDNRDNSRDSRLWGFVPEKLVVGKVVGIF